MNEESNDLDMLFDELFGEPSKVVNTQTGRITSVKKLVRVPYYSKELDRPLNIFKTNSDCRTMLVKVVSGVTQTKYLTVNLESIPAIRAMLDEVEQILLETKSE